MSEGLFFLRAHVVINNTMCTETTRVVSCRYGLGQSPTAFVGPHDRFAIYERARDSHKSHKTHARFNNFRFSPCPHTRARARAYDVYEYTRGQ